jgi:hypothetical protein
VYFGATGTASADVLDGAIARVPVAGGTVEVIAPRQFLPNELAVDATHVYWTTRGVPPNYRDGSNVFRVPKAGGPIQQLAEFQENAEDIAVNDTHVFWVNSGAYVRTGAIMKLAKP